MAIAKMTKCLGLFCVLLFATELHALTIHYDLNRDDALKSCDTVLYSGCLLYTSPSPRDATLSRMPSSA